MAHDFLSKMFDGDSRAAGIQTVICVVGAFFFLDSLIARMIFSHPFYTDLLAFAAALLLSAPLIYHGLSDLWNGRVDMNELAALGSVAALAAGEYLTASAISFFMIISYFIEHRSAMGARKSIETLIRLTPKKTTRIDDGTETEVDVGSLRPGHRIRLRPGDSVPADGQVISGTSDVNQATITGESLPVEKSEGDTVFSGTMNMSGVMDVAVTQVGEQTTLGKVKQLILHAQQTRTPIVRMMNRYARLYTPLILMLAGMVLFFTRDVSRVISMIIIACPCSILLSSPTAVVAALGAASRLGVLIKNMVDLETAKKVTAIVFDKTGTLTTGELSVSAIRTADGISENDLLQRAASVAMNSTHPISRAVVREARNRQLDMMDTELFKEVPGMGITAVFNSREHRLGRASWIMENGIRTKELDDSRMDNLSVLHVTAGRECIGWIGLEDHPRPAAAQAIDELRSNGISRIAMVTGDRESVARKVAAQVHCTDVRADVLPEDKVAYVNELKDQGYVVAVVGDGVNDAPALSAGDISIAMGAAGSDVAIHSASIALMNNQLDRIPFLFRLSAGTVQTIRQNMVFSALYILVLLMLSAGGFIHPVMAALLHSVSALAVILNSARLIRKGERLDDETDDILIAEEPESTDPTETVPAEQTMPQPSLRPAARVQ